MNLRCIIVDDEAIARRGLTSYVQQAGYLDLVGTYDNATAANEGLAQHPADLILLDIQMPGLSGLDFLRARTSPMMVIIISAYPQYALQGFELDVIDYIVKPVSFERFLKACNKARDYFLLKQHGGTSDDYFFIKADNRIERIEINKILFIEAVENYCNIYTAERKFMTLLSLKSLGETLAHSGFLRVHRSYLVATEKVESIDGSELIIGSHRVPVSRQLRNEVLQKILGDRYLRR